MGFQKLSLKGRALRLLAQREHSRSELEAKLAEAGHPLADKDDAKPAAADIATDSAVALEVPPPPPDPSGPAVPPPPTNPSGPAGPNQATAAAAAAKVLTQEAVTEALGADVPPRDAAERELSGGAFHALMDRLVARGLRAQLRNGSLVTGQLYVALDFFPGAGKARANWAARPPQLPTQRGSLDELQATLARIAGKLDRLPLDDIAAETRRAIAGLARAVDRTEALMARLDGLASNEVRATVDETRLAMAEARAAVADGRRLLASDAPLQQDLRDSLQELSRAAQALRHLADTLERHPEALLRGKPEEKP